jgi:hypothetical protein
VAVESSAEDGAVAFQFGEQRSRGNICEALSPALSQREREIARYDDSWVVLGYRA